jgi:hypothetical protein
VLYIDLINRLWIQNRSNKGRLFFCEFPQHLIYYFSISLISEMSSIFHPHKQERTSYNPVFGSTSLKRSFKYMQKNTPQRLECRVESGNKRKNKSRYLTVHLLRTLRIAPCFPKKFKTSDL